MITTGWFQAQLDYWIILYFEKQISFSFTMSSKCPFWYLYSITITVHYRPAKTLRNPRKMQSEYANFKTECSFSNIEYLWRGCGGWVWWEMEGFTATIRRRSHRTDPRATLHIYSPIIILAASCQISLADISPYALRSVSSAQLSAVDVMTTQNQNKNKTSHLQRRQGRVSLNTWKSYLIQYNSTSLENDIISKHARLKDKTYNIFLVWFKYLNILFSLW